MTIAQPLIIKIGGEADVGFDLFTIGKFSSSAPFADKEIFEIQLAVALVPLRQMVTASLFAHFVQTSR